MGFRLLGYWVWASARCPIRLENNSRCSEESWQASFLYSDYSNTVPSNSDEEYLGEFHKLIRAVEDQFTIGDTPYEQLVSSIGAIETEMNHNGGCNWQEKDCMCV